MQHRAVLDRKGNPTGEYCFNASGATRALGLLGKRFKLLDENEKAQELVHPFSLSAPPPLVERLAEKIRKQLLEAEGQQIAE
jgi:hypothetical protein